jgi:hypothetical protein
MRGEAIIHIAQTQVPVGSSKKVEEFVVESALQLIDTPGTALAILILTYGNYTIWDKNNLVYQLCDQLKHIANCAVVKEKKTPSCLAT